MFGLALAAGAVAGCDDTPRISQPVFLTAGTGGGLGGAPGAGGAQAGVGGAAGRVWTGGRSGQSGGAAGGPAGAPGAAGAGGAGGATVPVHEAPAPVGLASVNSDYVTTSVSLLNPAGGVLVPDCVATVAGSPGGMSTLSGDVVLPSQPQHGGALVLIDRSYGALTFVNTSPIAAAPCIVHAVIPIPGGSKMNPHDVVIFADDRAYVTRYNRDASASSPQYQGNDVVVINPSTGAFVQRIPLDGYASSGNGPVLVRPDRAVLAGGMIVVSLNQVDESFATYGDGAVVLIDPASNQPVASISIPNLYNCEGMDYIASSHKLLVACGGGSVKPNQPLQSGIAVIDLGATPPRLDQIISSIAFDGRPLDFSWVVAGPTAATPNRAFAASADPNLTGPDAMFQFDFKSGAVVQVTTAPAFTLGAPAVSGDVLFVPQALSKAPKVQLYDVSGPVTVQPQPISTFSPDHDYSLPPRQIAWY